MADEEITREKVVASAVRLAVREALRNPRHTHDEIAAIAYQATLAAQHGVDLLQEGGE